MILSCRYKLSYTAWSNWVKVWNSATFNPDDYLPLSGGKTITGDVGLAAGKRLIEDGRNIIGRFAFGDDESLRTIIGANIYEVLLISTAAIKRNTGGIEYTIWDSGNFNPDDKFGFVNAVSDLNNAPINAAFSTNNDAANTPVAGSYFQGFTFAMDNNPNFKRQWAFKDGKIWFRYLHASSWSAWTDVIPLDNYLPLSGGKTITGDVGLAAGKRLIEDGRNIIGRFAFGDDESLRTIIGANIYEVLLISTAAIKRNTGGIEYTLWDSGNFNPSDYLSKENTTVYVPTGEYNPATKGYVDSAVENGSMKEVTTTNLNAILTEGTCFFTFPQSSTNAPTVDPGGGLQIDLTNKFVQFVTTFPSSSKAGPSFYRTSNTGSASTFSPWVCLAENGDFGQNVYFEQQLDATHFNDAPVIKKLVKRSYPNKYGPATVVLDNFASTQFPGTSSQYAPIAFRGYAKFTNYSTKATLAIVPVNSQSNNNYAFFTYVNPSSIYQVMANFTGGLASVQEQVDYLVEITYGKVV